MFGTNLSTISVLRQLELEIDGAKRRMQLLEEENEQVKSRLQATQAKLDEMAAVADESER